MCPADRLPTQLTCFLNLNMYSFTLINGHLDKNLNIASHIGRAKQHGMGGRGGAGWGGGGWGGGYLWVETLRGEQRIM